jgi:hypothetical protein
MQSMNQSLLALLVNDVIDYRVAMEKSLDPEDLSLKLRKMFPHIEERYREEGMAPSPADFAEIMELMEIKKLYEEQEERWKQRLAEKDEIIADLQAQLAQLRQEMSSNTTLAAELRNQLEAMRAEKARLEAESKETIARLQERIKELNQQLAAAGGGKPPEKPTTGFFKR